MPCVFGEIKMSFWVQKNVSYRIFGKARKAAHLIQLITFRISKLFCSLKVQLTYPNSYIFLSV